MKTYNQLLSVLSDWIEGIKTAIEDGDFTGAVHEDLEQSLIVCEGIALKAQAELNGIPYKGICPFCKTPINAGDRRSILETRQFLQKPDIDRVYVCGDCMDQLAGTKCLEDCVYVLSCPVDFDLEDCPLSI